MKKWPFYSLILGVGVILLMHSASFAQEKPFQGREHKSGMEYLLLKHHASELGISDQQLESIKQLSLNAEKEMIRIKADKKIIELDFHAEMDTDKPDKKKISGLLDKINDLEGKIKKEKVLMLIDIKAVLTPEQMTKIKELRAQRQMRKERHQRDSMDRRMPRQRHSRDQFDDPEPPPPVEDPDDTY
ncbi:Spy/CpxP family protein refolding chaperone [candidate division CSSED10-310 bacterium]|uniref:Spy/CpxP family protein refolding chaperone n=1 Tax=candidate division CSSED10-310 bacterium TaxID=2855610 RepID=A0ABV6YYH7_UNCC1